MSTLALFCVFGYIYALKHIESIYIDKTLELTRKKSNIESDSAAETV